MAESGNLKEDLSNVCLLSFLVYFQFSLESPFNFLYGKKYFILNNDGGGMLQEANRMQPSWKYLTL